MKFWNIGDKHIEVFRNISEQKLNSIAKRMGAQIIDMDMDEEWTLCKEYFPGVTINILYQYYGDEFGVGDEDELQFLFSGEKVRWVSGEDLAHFCEITVSYMDLLIQDKPFSTVYDGEPNEMLKKGLRERSQPFFMIDEEKYGEIANFIGGNALMSNPEKEFSISKEIFPDFNCIFWGTKNKSLDFQVDGEALKILPVYDTQRLVLMIVNHALRQIKGVLKANAPKVCNLMFSGYYKKTYPELF